MGELEDIQIKRRPAITINTQSWATPLVGLVMLIVGLFGGYYGRPLIGSTEEGAAIPQAIAP